MLTGLFCIALVLLSKCGNAFSKNHDLEEKFEEHSITSEIVGLLNGTYFNINEKVCQLQRRVDAIEGATDVDNQCECNKTAILEFKRSISNKIKDISKVLSGFENEIRVMKKEHAELFERLGRGDSEASTSTTTTTTTTATPRACDNGWIVSPEKCYFVSSNFQKTEWTIAIDRCTAMGANLVEIKTDEEAQFIMNSLPSYVGNADLVYTGRRRNDANDWVFVSNEEIVDTSVRSWNSGEPDGGTQRCGCTQKTDDFRMHDCFCTGFNLFYICEIER